MHVSGDTSLGGSRPFLTFASNILLSDTRPHQGGGAQPRPNAAVPRHRCLNRARPSDTPPPPTPGPAGWLRGFPRAESQRPRPAWAGVSNACQQPRRRDKHSLEREHGKGRRWRPASPSHQLLWRLPLERGLSLENKSLEYLPPDSLRSVPTMTSTPYPQAVGC